MSSSQVKEIKELLDNANKEAKKYVPNETGYKYESWHFRYVGKDLAAKLYNGGNWITLENYYGITSKYDY